MNRRHRDTSSSTRTTHSVKLQMLLINQQHKGITTEQSLLQCLHHTTVKIRIQASSLWEGSKYGIYIIIIFIIIFLI